MPRRYRPMPPLTRRAERALRKTIAEKWEPLANGKTTAADCALCEEFITDREFCTKCPVAIRAGELGCTNTPYMRIEGIRGSTQFIQSAKRELRFLRDTLRLGLKAREKKP